MANPWDSDPIVAPRPAGVFMLPRTPQQDATLAKSQTEANIATATLPDTIRQKRAEASKAEAELVVAQQKADEAKAEAALPTMAPNSPVHGEAYLEKYVPPALRETVKAYARGDLGSRSGGMSTSMLPIIQHAMNYDPTASGTNFPTRVAMQKQLTNSDSNSIGGGLRSMEQMLLHGSDVLDNSHALNNYHSGLGAVLNYPRAAWESFTNDPAFSAFRQSVKNYAPESQKSIAGGIGGEAERLGRAAGFSATMSPEAVAAGLQSDAKMAFQRMGAINDQYRRVMGRDITDALSPEAKAAYDKIMAGGYGPNGEALHPAAGWTPISGPVAGSSAGGTGGTTPPPPGGGPNAQAALGSDAATLASGSASSKSIPIPDAMQQAHAAYLAAHRGNIDPDSYANFRAEMDRQNGFPVTAASMESYRQFARDASQPTARVNTTIPPASTAMTGADKLKASTFNNPVGAAALGFGSLGGGMDEVAGTVRGLATGTPISTNIATINAERQAAANAYPLSTLLGNIGGTVALGGLAGKAIPGLASVAEGSPLLTGAAYGAGSGALENNDNRLGGAFMGGVTGLGGGATGKYLVAPLAERAMRSNLGQQLTAGVQRLRGQPFTPAPQLNATDSIVGGAKPDFSAIAQNLRDAGGLNLPYALADADPKLRQLGGSVARFSPNARALAENTFLPRANGQADRAVNAIDTHLAPITNVEQRGSDLLAAGDQAAGPYYNLAMDRPGPVDPQIAAMVQTPAGQTALQRARAIAANRGTDPNKIGFDLDQQGNVVLKNVPSFETLQLVKRGIDSHLEDFRDPITRSLNLRGNLMAESVNDLRARFVSRLGELNPNYAEGNQVWKGYADRKDALDLGYGTLPNNAVPQRQFDTSLAGLTDATRPEAQMGMATALADQVNKVRLSRNPYDTIYGSPLQQQKIGAMFPQGAPNFNRTYQLEQDMGKTATETLGGSQTQPRAQADAQFTNGIMPGAIDMGVQALTGGGIPHAATAALRLARAGLGDRARMGMFGAASKADAIAPTLFDTSNPTAIADLVDQMAAKYAALGARRAAYGQNLGLLGGVLAPSAMLGP